VWTKQQQVTEPSRSSIAPPGATATARTATPVAAQSAVIGPSLTIKGQVTGSEALHIDGKVDGPISLIGHELTVGPKAQLNSEMRPEQ
jgi:cytoskeletal protein CcmA (bactofilin family)